MKAFPQWKSKRKHIGQWKKKKVHGEGEARALHVALTSQSLHRLLLRSSPAAARARELIVVASRGNVWVGHAKQSARSNIEATKTCCVYINSCYGYKTSATLNKQNFNLQAVIIRKMQSQSSHQKSLLKCPWNRMHLNFLYLSSGHQEARNVYLKQSWKQYRIKIKAGHLLMTHHVLVLCLSN